MSPDDAPMSKLDAYLYATTGPLGEVCRELLAAHPEFLAEDAADVPLVVVSDPDASPVPLAADPQRKAA